MKRIWLVSSAAASLLAMAMTSAALAQTQSPQQQQNPTGQQNAAAQPGQSGQAAQQTQNREQGRPGQVQSTDPNRRFSVDAGASGAAMQANRRSPDAELAACLIVGNEGEVFAGQFAQQHAQSEDVKKFAAEMVSAHGQMIQKLQRFAGDAGQANRSTIGTTGVGADDRNATNTVAAPAANAAANAGQAQPAMQANRAGGQLDHVALKRELGELCKQTFEREFSQKSGAEFDKCYMGQQVGMHLHAIDAMKVARNHASPELQSVLDEGIQTSEQHLQHAKDLAKKLEESN